MKSPFLLLSVSLKAQANNNELFRTFLLAK